MTVQTRATAPAVGKTPFSVENDAYSAAGHKQAVRDIYPRIFPGLTLTAEDVTFTGALNIGTDDQRHLDGQWGIDVILRVTRDDALLGLALPFSVQERHRKPENLFYAKRDLTITLDNPNGEPSEYEKCIADYLCYTCYDQDAGRFLHVVVVDYHLLRRKLITGRLFPEKKPGTNPRSGQHFAVFTLGALRQAKVIALEYDGITWTDYLHPLVIPCQN